LPSFSSENDDPSGAAARARQLAAACYPDRPARDLLGNFGDFESLFEQLGQPQTIELGTPLPNPKYLPKSRVGKCPAAHNRALLGEELNSKRAKPRSKPSRTSHGRKPRR
jgi:hypothetical protein